MNRELKTLFLFFLFVSSFTIQAIPIDFDCSVKNLLTSSEDDEFINSNLKKRFVISVSEQEVIVTSISDVYKSGITKYKIIYRDKVFPIVRAVTQNHQNKIAINTGNGNATISLQSDFYLNAWVLDCKKWNEYNRGY